MTCLLREVKRAALISPDASCHSSLKQCKLVHAGIVDYERMIDTPAKHVQLFVYNNCIERCENEYSNMHRWTRAC